MRIYRLSVAGTMPVYYATLDVAERAAKQASREDDVVHTVDLVEIPFPRNRTVQAAILNGTYTLTYVRKVSAWRGGRRMKSTLPET